jgi:ATP-binding cassette subfamily B (MDR/TAP) protein 1
MAADNIIVMKDGLIFEQGTHHELLKRDGLYAAMVRAQDLGTKANEEDVQKELRDTEEVEEALNRKATLQRTHSQYDTNELARKVEQLAAGTLGYSLIKCVWIMLKENIDLYYWYAATIVGGIIGGGTYPAQAIIFSRLVRVFTLQGSEAQDEANFWALMFFVLAIANLFAYFTIGLACNGIGL